MAEVGKQAHQEQMMQEQNQLATDREATIARVKDKLEKENIENQQQFQMKGAAAGREFEMGKEGREHIFQHGENVSKQASELEGRRISGAARVDAAAVGAYSRTSTTKAPKGDWAPHNVNVGPAMKLDPHTNKMIPDYAAPPRQAMGLANSRTGEVYNLQGDRLYEWDNDKMQNIRDPSSTSRAVRPGEVEDLLRDPHGTVPDGPNQGVPKYLAFKSQHGWLPSAFLGATQSTPSGAASGGSSTSSGYKLPSGRMFNPPPGGGAVAPASGPTADLSDND